MSTARSTSRDARLYRFAGFPLTEAETHEWTKCNDGIYLSFGWPIHT